MEKSDDINPWKLVFSVVFVCVLIAILISLWATGTFGGTSNYHMLNVTILPAGYNDMPAAGPIEVSIYNSETGSRIGGSNIPTSTSGTVRTVLFSISNVDHAIVEINVLKPIRGYIGTESRQFPINSDLYTQYICLGTGSIFLTLDEAIDGCLGN